MKKSTHSGRTKIKKWSGHLTLDLKTGKSEWKMKRDQKTKNYREKPLKGEHLHAKRRNWKKGFERLAHNFASKNKQIRRSKKKEREKTKRK